MEIDNKYKYFAFISYKREDEKWAKWLQHKLEHFKLPYNLNGRTDLPKEIRPVFRDQSELAGGVLAEEIQNALENSKYLIVICSPRAAQSQWVGKEVQSFISMGRIDRIIPFIVGGTVRAQNSEDECFPFALLNLPPNQELLGINIDEMGRDAAAVKVIAKMFGLQFDELWQRNEREQRKRRNWLIVVCIIGFFAMIGVAVWMFIQRQQTMKANWKMMENQSRYIAEKANNLIEEGNPYTALRLLLEVLPKEKQDKPITIEAERAFRNAYNFNTAFLKAQDDIISSIAISPDGRYVVSATRYDATVKIWDMKTGAEIRTIEGYSGWVNSSTFSPDGECIVLAFYDRTIKIWNIETGDCIQTLKEHPNRVNSASYSPDGKHIVTASCDSTVRIWGVETGCLIQTLKIQSANFDHYNNFDELKSDDSMTIAHRSVIYDYRIGYPYQSVSSAVFSPDGNFIVSEFFNNIIIWDVETGEPIRILKGHTGVIKSVSFSPDGTRIVSASNDTTAKIWNAETGECLLTFQGVLSAAFSHDGEYVVSESCNNTTIIWNAKTGKVLQTFEESRYYHHSPAFSPDGKYIISASFKNVSIRAAATGERLCFCEEQPMEFVPVAFSPNGKLVVSTSEDNAVLVIDAETGMVIQKLNGHTSIVYSANYSPNGKYIVSASDDKTLRIWNAKSGNCIHTLNGHTDAILSAAFSPDGRRVVSASADSTIRIWNVETGKELIRLKGHSGIVYSASFSPDGKRVVSASVDGTVKIWSTKTGKETETIDFQNSETTHGSICPDEECFSTSAIDGKYVVTSVESNIQTTKIMDVETGKDIQTLRGDVWLNNSVAYTPDGERIVAAYCNTVIVYDLKTGAEIQIYKGLSDDQSDIDFAVISPNGRRIASVSEGEVIHIWDFPPLQELIDQTQGRFKDRPLTPKERRMYYLE